MKRRAPIAPARPRTTEPPWLPIQFWRLSSRIRRWKRANCIAGSVFF